MLIDKNFVSLVYILLMNKRLKFHFSHLDEGLGKWIFFQARYNAVFSSSNISDLTVTACMEALAFLMTPAHPHCPVAALLRRLPPPNTSILTCVKIKIATTNPTTGQDIANSKKVSITILAIYYTCIGKPFKTRSKFDL